MDCECIEGSTVDNRRVSEEGISISSCQWKALVSRTYVTDNTRSRFMYINRLLNYGIMFGDSVIKVCLLLSVCLFLLCVSVCSSGYGLVQTMNE